MKHNFTPVFFGELVEGVSASIFRQWLKKEDYETKLN